MSTLYNGTVTYNESTNTYTVSTSVSTPDLENLLNTAKDFSTIQFDAGKYVLTEEVDVTRGNLTIKGAGENQTIFEAQFTKPGNIMNFSGMSTDQISTLQNSITAGTKVITVSDASKFAVGNEVKIYQANDAAFLNQPIPASLATDPYLRPEIKAAIQATGTLYGNIAHDGFVNKIPLRSDFTQIERIEGNTLYLKDAVDFNLTGGQAQVQKINTLDNLHLSDFTTQTNLGPSDPSSMTNTVNWMDVNSIGLTFTRGATVNNVAVLNSASNGLELDYSYGAKVDNVSIIGAHDKGDGAVGYGLNLAGTQHSTFTNMTIMDTRHAVVFSSWGTEIGNTIQIDQTNRDVNYHGGPDQGNVVTVDQSILNYYTSNTGVGVLGTFWVTHPYTDISANSTHFTYAVSLIGSDIIEGTDHGAYLRGGGGADNLIGGKGNDVLIGDAGQDTLTGGKGADIFVFTNEQPGWGATDTVNDFNAQEGDKLFFLNTAKTILPADIVITAMGADTQVSINGLGTAALLKNVTADHISLNNIILNVKPYSDDPAAWRANAMDYTPPAPPADPAVHFRAGNAAETFTSGSGDDSVIGWNAALQNDHYNLGAGVDTMIIQTAGVWMPAQKMPVMTGVDVIDLTPSSGVGTVGVTDAIVQQSDHGSMLIKNAGMQLTLSAKLTDPHLSLVVESASDVHLANGVSNRVIASDHNTGAIIGGDRADTLYGGASQDIFTGGKGADVFTLQSNTDGKTDIITDFNTQEDDVLNVAHLLTGYDPLQNSINDFLRLATDASGHTSLSVDRDGSGTAFTMQKAVDFGTAVSDSVDALIASHALIVT